jgi:transporter family protein
MLLWGVNGVTQRLSTNSISSELSFLWFGAAMIALGLTVLPLVVPRWQVPTKDFWLAVMAGTLYCLGAYTSFAALEKGGKASIVIPLCYLYPLLTIVLAIVFLHETLTRSHVAGISLAVVAAILLSQESPPNANKTG